MTGLGSFNDSTSKSVLRTRSVHWEFVLCCSFSALTLTVGNRKDIRPVPEQVEEEETPPEEEPANSPGKTAVKRKYLQQQQQ